jgi:hypothetical protein
MSFVQENKFLSGLIAVTVLGAGALGYLTWDAMAKYDAASDELQKTTEEKKRLESLPVYPNQKNLEKLNQDREEHVNRIQDLQKKLSTMAIAEESISPQGFQDRLRAAVTAYTKKAAEAGMKIPDTGANKFYMGFDVYQTKTPDDIVAPKLLRQLKAIEFVMNLLPEHRVEQLDGITRNPLPEEAGRRATATPPPKGGAPKKGEPATPLVNRNSFEFSFHCEPGPLQNILNSIATAKNQFYIIRNIRVENTRQTPPTREEILQKLNPAGEAGTPTAPPAGAPGATAPAVPAAPTAPAPPAAPAPGTPAAPADAAAPAAPAPAENSGVITFIVGEERVAVSLLVEIADFTPPPQPETKGKKK